MRILYVTDLDGTLMRDDKSISYDSIAILNRLISQKVCITYATARSIHSASEITKDIAFELPVIIRNGTVLADPQSNKEIAISVFGEEVQQIRKILANAAIPGFVTAYFDSKELKLCRTGRMNVGFQDYLQKHSEDKRMKIVETEDELYEGQTCYFTFIAPKDELLPLYEKIKHLKNINVVFQQDKYRPEYWLELCPRTATKAMAIRRIQQMYKCEKVVVFGDSLNDISMFQAADESYAVNNAMDELKDIATGIIADNNSDGVAKWLSKNA